MSYSDSNKLTVHLDNQDMDGGESDISYTEDENISIKESRWNMWMFVNHWDDYWL